MGREIKQAGLNAAGLGRRVAEHREKLPLAPMSVVGLGSGYSTEQTLLWSHWCKREPHPSPERFLCLGGYGPHRDGRSGSLAVGTAGNRVSRAQSSQSDNSAF